MKFKLNLPFKPTGDQPEAIDKLVSNLKNGMDKQVLVGVTGSGKTFTMANVIARLNRPTLILSHNKTLAGQLYQEFREFFPENAVSYFVSYYDYYQPEAYVPQTDTYIEKETEINEEIDKLRLESTANILTRKDTIVVASVSCIYNIGSPREYGHFVLELKPGIRIARRFIMERLIQLQYERNDYGFHRGTFRVRGETIDIFPAYKDVAIRIIFRDDLIDTLTEIDPLTGKESLPLPGMLIYPAKHFMTDPAKYKDVFEAIKSDLEKQVLKFQKEGKLIEAQRISQRVNFDLEMIAEMGYVNGIENYSRYFDGRTPGSPPFTLFDYYREAYGDKKNDYLLFVDESHMSIPQVRGMYNGDRSRKQTLIDYGFRLPAALDNRPMRFDEFARVTPQTVYVSATPNEWEISQVKAQANSDKPKNQLSGIVEQLIRPTGLVDPEIDLRPAKTQVVDLITEIQKRQSKNERVLVTALTKRMSEDLAKHLAEIGLKVHYLHSEILTLERSDILADLRSGKYDVIVGVNLLREGLDLPEVSLVAILDADKEGFLRSRTSLVQTMGRAARHVSGKVILYADKMTDSMQYAIDEVKRRRDIQMKYNIDHGITPQGITKPIRGRITPESRERPDNYNVADFSEKTLDQMTPLDRKNLAIKVRNEMRSASHDLRFEDAAKFRDMLKTIETN